MQYNLNFVVHNCSMINSQAKQLQSIFEAFKKAITPKIKIKTIKTSEQMIIKKVQVKQNLSAFIYINIIANNFTILVQQSCQKSNWSNRLKGRIDMSCGLNIFQTSGNKVIIIIVKQATQNMIPNYYNLAFLPYNLSFPPFLYLQSCISYPFSGTFQEVPPSSVKLQSKHVEQPIRIKDSSVNCAKTFKSLKKDNTNELSTPILENSGNDKYNDFDKNILPNNIHLVLSYIRRINKSGPVVDRVIKKISQNTNLYSKKKFYSYQNYIKERLANSKYNNMIESTILHIDPTSTVFSIEEQKFYNKVTRILIFNFLRDGALANVLSSTKITKTKKDEHIKIQRLMMAKIEALE